MLLVQPHNVPKTLVLPGCIRRGYSRYTLRTIRESASDDRHRESEGNHYLVEVVNTSLGGQVGRGGIPSVIPDFSWKHFASLPDAETSVNAQYEASLKEGFRPLPPEPM